MPAITLNSEQKKIIKKYINVFKKYTQGEQFQEHQKDRLDRVSYFQNKLPKRVDKLSETEISELITMLWASQMWGNKQYFAQKIISQNGIEKLRDEFKLLLNKSLPVATRYERFLKEVKSLGPASLTEMLCYIQPETCGIWNQKARQGLKILGLNTYIDTEKYRISSEEYNTFNEILQAVSKELKNAGFQDVDMLFVDFFLYQVSQTSKPPEPESFDHDEIKDMIQNIGIMLGFEAETEV
ncbi:MAG: hypothetical protein J7K83_00140 [Candidatus Aenigmarchaeota archaeon]|nr:hypothetical protein [Candidatus Aenigmarchaeota archaeon]